MRINIVINDALLAEAFKYTDVKNKKDLIEIALRVFIHHHRRGDISILRGKDLIDPSYNYRAARQP